MHSCTSILLLVCFVLLGCGTMPVEEREETALTVDWYAEWETGRQVPVCRIKNQTDSPFYYGDRPVPEGRIPDYRLDYRNGAGEWCPLPVAGGFEGRLRPLAPRHALAFPVDMPAGLEAGTCRITLALYDESGRVERAVVCSEIPDLSARRASEAERPSTVLLVAQELFSGR